LEEIILNLDFNKIIQVVFTDHSQPLVFNSGLFLFVLLFALIVYQFLFKQKNLRVLFLIAFSLFFYYKSGGYFFSLLIAVAVVDFFLGRFIARSQSDGIKKLLLFSGVVINLAPLAYFKYTNFFYEIYQHFKQVDQIALLDIALPVGISFFIFKGISYIADMYYEKYEPVENFPEFLLYISYFANILAGPIDRADQFIPQLKKDVYISKEELGTALFFIMTGLIKKAVIADYIGQNFIDRVFEDPLRFTGVENLMAIYGYTIQIFLDFSGYTDMAIGISLLFGIKLMQNFREPYKATSVAEFWRRWHISLSSWLQDYLFKPLQMMMRDMRIFGNALALIITFFICGLWHGAGYGLILWGLLHGLIMAFSLLTLKLRKKITLALHLNGTKALTFLQIVITFHLIALAWVFFRSSSVESAFSMFKNIFEAYHGVVFLQFVKACPMVIVALASGAALIFAPSAIKRFGEKTMASVPMAGKALMLIIVVYLVIQVRSADLQPFIYFQF
jgi:D-alanyl-lipoteichoic acid acyltransferase DltB (MBOAT superfamily)